MSDGSPVSANWIVPMENRLRDQGGTYLVGPLDSRGVDTHIISRVQVLNSTPSPQPLSSDPVQRTPEDFHFSSVPFTNRDRNRITVVTFGVRSLRKISGIIRGWIQDHIGSKGTQVNVVDDTVRGTNIN